MKLILNLAILICPLSIPNTFLVFSQVKNFWESQEAAEVVTNENTFPRCLYRVFIKDILFEIMCELVNFTIF